MRKIGIDSNRDRLDDTFDFHAELQSIEISAQTQRENAAEDHEKRIADIANERNKDLLGASRDFVGDSLDAFETFEKALSNAESPADIFGANDQLNETIGRQLQGLIESIIGDEADSLFSVEGFDAFEFLGISGANNLTSDSFIQSLTSKLPDVIGRLRQGELLGGSDTQADSLAQVLQGVSVNDNTGGILGTFRDESTTEDARYLEALDNIDKWEIDANEVILNTQSLIIQAGIDKDDAEGASLIQRDSETQVIAEGNNQGQAAITDQEIGVKQTTRDAINKLMVDYANQILTIDAQTRVAIRSAQKQAADSFWSGVLEIGGTVIGVAAGVALSAATGGVIPPNIAIAAGAQLGKAGGGLLADAVIDDDELFHFPQADEIARQAGKTAKSGRGVFGSIQKKNAEDFSKYFGEGFAESNGNGSPQRVNEVHILAEKVILQGLGMDRDVSGSSARPDITSDKDTPIASGGVYQAPKRLTMGDVLGEGVGEANYARSFKEARENPLKHALEVSGDYGGLSEKSGDEVLSSLTSSNYYGSLVKAIATHKRFASDNDLENDKYLKDLEAAISQYANLFTTNEVANLVSTSGFGYLLKKQNALFHFPETDWIAQDIAKSETLRRDQETPYFADQDQIRNARDVSREIVKGVTEGLDIGNRRNGIGEQQNPVNLNLTLMIDSEQLITPRVAERVSDQISINEQNGNNRR